MRLNSAVMRLLPYLLLLICPLVCVPAQGGDAAQAAPVSAESAVQQPYENAEQLIEIACRTKMDEPWYTESYGSASHATEKIANGVLFAYCKDDESNLYASELQLECVIKLFLTNYKSAELAWFQCTKPEIRVMILAVFYSGMNERICCFPRFGKFSRNCFGEPVGAQREAELRWVSEHKDELRAALRPLLRQARTQKKESYADGT